MAKTWLVISPEMSTTIPVMDCGDGPQESFRCAAEICAATGRQAIRQAIRHPDMSAWVSERRSDGLSPFVGLRAELQNAAIIEGEEQEDEHH